MSQQLDDDKRVLLILTLQDAMKRLAWVEDELCGLGEEEEQENEDKS